MVETRDKGELARRFESEMFQTYEIAKKACRYNANRFLQMLYEHREPTARQLSRAGTERASRVGLRLSAGQSL